MQEKNLLTYILLIFSKYFKFKLTCFMKKIREENHKNKNRKLFLVKIKMTVVSFYIFLYLIKVVIEIDSRKSR